MPVIQHHIEQRSRANAIAICSPEDFGLSDPTVVDAQQVVEDPNVTLYCLDLPGERAVFVRTSENASIYDAPFLYQRQYETAQAILTVPLDELSELARHSGSRLGRLGFVFSVGRSGSTLVSRLLAETPGVRSVSEPDFLSQLVTADRTLDCRADPRITRLVRDCLPFCVPATDGGDFYTVIKPRGYVVQIAPEIWEAFPAMRSVMLYRNAEETVASFLRVLDGRAGLRPPRSSWALKPALLLLPKRARESLHRLVPVFERIPMQKWATMGLSGLVLAHWVSSMEGFMRVREMGHPVAPIRYEDLVEDPRETVQRLLGALEIPAERVDELLSSVLREDAQAGTALARDEGVPGLTRGERAQIRQWLTKLPEIQALQEPTPRARKATGQSRPDQPIERL